MQEKSGVYQTYNYEFKEKVVYYFWVFESFFLGEGRATDFSGVFDLLIDIDFSVDILGVEGS